MDGRQTVTLRFPLNAAEVTRRDDNDDKTWYDTIW